MATLAIAARAGPERPSSRAMSAWCQEQAAALADLRQVARHCLMGLLLTRGTRMGATTVAVGSQMPLDAKHANGGFQLTAMTGATTVQLEERAARAELIHAEVTKLAHARDVLVPRLIRDELDIVRQVDA